jgi:hypothetical protein
MFLLKVFLLLRKKDFNFYYFVEKIFATKAKRYKGKTLRVFSYAWSWYNFAKQNTKSEAFFFVS